MYACMYECVFVCEGVHAREESVIVNSVSCVKKLFSSFEVVALSVILLLERIRVQWIHVLLLLCCLFRGSCQVMPYLPNAHFIIYCTLDIVLCSLTYYCIENAHFCIALFDCNFNKTLQTKNVTKTRLYIVFICYKHLLFKATSSKTTSFCTKYSFYHIYLIVNIKQPVRCMILSAKRKWKTFVS